MCCFADLAAVSVPEVLVTAQTRGPPPNIRGSAQHRLGARSRAHLLCLPRVCVCVCVCVGERKKKERERERKKERKRKRGRGRGRGRGRERGSQSRNAF